MDNSNDQHINYYSSDTVKLVLIYYKIAWYTVKGIKIQVISGNFALDTQYQSFKISTFDDVVNRIDTPSCGLALLQSTIESKLERSMLGRQLTPTVWVWCWCNGRCNAGSTVFTLTLLSQRIFSLSEILYSAIVPLTVHCANCKQLNSMLLSLVHTYVVPW